MSLTDAYCDWFESLAPEVGKELALHLMRLFPGGLLEPTLATADITDGFIPRMRRIGRPDARDPGHALTLVALTDFVFVSKGDPSQWAEDRARLDILDEAREALGDTVSDDVAQWVAENQLRYPLRAKQWAKANESWLAVRSGALSDNEIRTAVARLPIHN